MKKYRGIIKFGDPLFETSWHESEEDAISDTVHKMMDMGIKEEEFFIQEVSTEESEETKLIGEKVLEMYLGIPSIKDVYNTMTSSNCVALQKEIDSLSEMVCSQLRDLVFQYGLDKYLRLIYNINMYNYNITVNKVGKM